MGNPDIFFVIDDLRCDGCGACVPVCPVGAISEIDGYFIVDKGLCDGCGVCAEACHADAFREWSRAGAGGFSVGALGSSAPEPAKPRSGKGMPIREIYSRSFSDLKENNFITVPVGVLNALYILLAFYQTKDWSGRRQPLETSVNTVLIVFSILMFVASLVVSLWVQCMAAQLVAWGRSSLVNGLRRLVSRAIPVILASLLMLCILLGVLIFSIFILKAAGMPERLTVIVGMLLMLIVLVLVSLVPTAIIYDGLGPLTGFRTGLDRVSHNLGKVLIFYLFLVALLLLVFIGMMLIIGFSVSVFEPEPAFMIIYTLSMIINTFWSVLFAIAMMRLYSVLPAPGAKEDTPAAPPEAIPETVV